MSWKRLFSCFKPSKEEVYKLMDGLEYKEQSTFHDCCQPNKDNTKQPQKKQYEGCQPTDRIDFNNPPIVYYDAVSKLEPTEPFESIYELNRVAERSHNKGNFHEAGKLLGIIKRRIIQYEENEMYKS